MSTLFPRLGQFDILGIQRLFCPTEKHATPIELISRMLDGVQTRERLQVTAQNKLLPGTPFTIGFLCVQLDQLTPGYGVYFEPQERRITTAKGKHWFVVSKGVFIHWNQKNGYELKVGHSYYQPPDETTKSWNMSPPSSEVTSKLMGYAPLTLVDQPKEDAISFHDHHQLELKVTQAIITIRSTPPLIELY